LIGVIELILIPFFLIKREKKSRTTKGITLDQVKEKDQKASPLLSFFI